VSGERIRLEPEATAEEAEAVRQALAALGLVEPSPPQGDGPQGVGDRDP
jgi:hypothetical protein